MIVLVLSVVTHLRLPSAFVDSFKHWRTFC